MKAAYQSLKVSLINTLACFLARAASSDYAKLSISPTLEYHLIYGFFAVSVFLMIYFIF